MHQHVDLTVPNATAFRGWLENSLDILGLRAHRLCEISGVGKNAARKFLTGEQADLRLNTASALVEAMQSQADAKGIELPPLPNSCDQQSRAMVK